MATRNRKPAKRSGATRRVKALVKKVRRAVGRKVAGAKRSTKARRKTASRRTGARKAAARR